MINKLWKYALYLMLPTVAPVFQLGAVVGSFESGCQITVVGKSALCGNVFQIFVAVFQQHAGFMLTTHICKNRNLRKIFHA